MRLRFLTVLLLLPTLAQAEPGLRSADEARLEGFDEAFGSAVMQALAGGAEADVAAEYCTVSLTAASPTEPTSLRATGNTMPPPGCRGSLSSSV